MHFLNFDAENGKDRMLSAALMKNTDSNTAAKATILHFEPVNGRENFARAEILLCNISDRPLYYILKCSASGGITARPSSNGRISAKSSSRVLLTWRRSADRPSWNGVEKPKILLVTHFVDSHERPTKEITSTRLMAKITDTVSATPDSEPPTEQFLLDAVTNRNNMPNHSPESCSVEHLQPEVRAVHYPYYQLPSGMTSMPPHHPPFIDKHFSPIMMLLFAFIIFLLILLLLRSSPPPYPPHKGSALAADRYRAKA